MKKVMIAMLFALSALNALAADTVESNLNVSGNAVTISAVTGAGINASVFTGTTIKNTVIPAIPIYTQGASLGVSGLSFRFLNSKMEGFEIPVNFTYSNSASCQDPADVSGSISLGYRLIFVLHRNDFMNFNLLPGLTGLYSYASLNPDLIHTFGVVPSVTGEVEVSIGKVLGIPSEALKIGTGFGIYAQYTYTRSYSHGVFYNSGYRLNVSTSSFGSVLTSLSIRYYM